MKLAWNAIVKNEAAVIERCLTSLLPHVDCGIVVDTGSTDNTPDLIKQAFFQANKPVEIRHTLFENFEQARNRALHYARTSDLDWDYLLLVDADMELRVKQQPWFHPNGGLAYDMRQAAGALGYYNRRLVSRKAQGWYVGVTHEYLDIPADGKLDTADFLDHADGYNRPDKFARDIALLEAALRTEHRPGLVERYHFYLAQSYFDACDWAKAADHYKTRVGLGGYDEERWYAQLQYAHCRRHLGDPAGFLWEMLQAHRMRPQRVETLHAVAQFFRERADNDNSLLFSEAALQLPYPDRDMLFVNDYVYKTGLREEFSICAYYDERRRKRGAKMCNKLALEGSEQARGNLYWYLQPLIERVPSFQPQQIKFTSPEGYVACNPSVINYDGQPLTLVRTVNYTITPEGRYAIRDAAGDCSDHNPIRTRNFLVWPTFVADFNATELALPKNWSEPKYPLVRGFEDSRLFEWNGILRTSSTVRELTPEGWCEQVFATLTEHGYDVMWRQMLPQERRHEKNWMPWVNGDDLRFVYRLGSLVDSSGGVVFESDPGFDVSHISGGSQVVQIDERTWLGVVHEARMVPGLPNRFYQHRFVGFLSDGRVDRISPPFCFFDRQIEFAAGLAYFSNKKELVVSFGVRDCEAWLATMKVDEVLSFTYGDAL